MTNYTQEKVINYYEIYHLDRTASREELKKQLRSEQGKIKAMMSAGALNQEYMEKLTVLDNRLRDALKVLKTDDTRATYDAKLDEAIINGTVDNEQQSKIQGILDEIKALFEKYDFPAVVSKCREAINESIIDADVYGYLSRSYAALGRNEDALKAAEDGIEKNPNNTYALSLGCRMTSDYGNDVTKFKSYIDRLNEVDSTGMLSAIEQGYYYLKKDSVERAFTLYDECIHKDPTNEEFRQKAAFDIIGCAAALYKDDPTGQLDIKAITSAEDYDLCLKLAKKAAQIYNNQTVKEFLEVTESFGALEEAENPYVKKAYKFEKFKDVFLIVSAVFCGILTVVGLFTTVMLVIPGLMFGLSSLYLHFLSPKAGKHKLMEIEKNLHRPMWQVYKYEFFGERELEELGIVDEYEAQKDFLVKGTKTGLRLFWDILRDLMSWG